MEVCLVPTRRGVPRGGTQTDQVRRDAADVEVLVNLARITPGI